MAHLISKDADFKLDNASASLTSIKGSVNNASIQGIQDALDDSGLGDEERTYVYGLAGSTLPVNGWLDSTTEAIFGPLVGNRTSITKTFAIYLGNKWFTGEALPQDVTLTGNVGEIQTWSCNLQVTGAVTRTSVAPS
jgi:hypothetical protein